MEEPSEFRVEEGGPAPGTRVLLIRHGETAWNSDGRTQGHRDVPLSERGLEEARRLGLFLAEEPLDAIYSSDLARARQTAERLAAAREPVPPLRVEPRLREARFGLFEGLTEAEAEARYPEAYRAWRADPERCRPPGGECLTELRDRCMAAFRELLARHPGGRVAMVAHGGPIRVILCTLLHIPLGRYWSLRVRNASVSRVYFGERGPILTGLNETFHLR